MTNCQQRVNLNGRTLKWTNILAGVPQGSVLGALLFLIYISDLPHSLKSICKIFADDTSLFSKINDIDTSNIDINNDLVKISRWSYQWKLSFNPDINKQATEVYFCQRREKSLPPPIIYNNNNGLISPCQKHLGLVLDSKLSFNEHVNQKINKCSKIIGLMKRLSLILSRKHILTIYKTFLRSLLDYADIIYDKPLNESFKEKLEKFQYFTALIITGAIKGTSLEHLHKKLGLESLSDRKWHRKLIFFYEIVKGLALPYLESSLLSDNERTYNTRSSLRNPIKTNPTRTSIFRAAFSPYCTKEWNQLNDDFKKIESIKKLKKTLMKVIKTKENSVFGVSDIYGIKLLTRLRLDFSHLNKHKFRHNFNGTINPMCNCGAATETTTHYVLRSQLYSFQRVKRLNGLYKLESALQNSSEDQLLTVFLYGSKKFALNLHKEIITLTISYLKASERFVQPLF